MGGYTSKAGTNNTFSNTCPLMYGLLYSCFTAALLLLYWYKIEKVLNFTCFPGTKVQILTRKTHCASICAYIDLEAPPLQRFSCYPTQRLSLLIIRTGAYLDLEAPPLQIAQRARIYLLYWYNSTNTDAEDAADLEALPSQTAQRALPLT